MQLTYQNTLNQYRTIRDVLTKHFDMSHRFISKLKQHQAILLNNIPMYIDKEIFPSDTITINLDIEETSPGIVPINQSLDILYEDDAILIINKPPYMPVHPSSSHFTDTLANAVQYYYNKQHYLFKIHLANRLDKDTSGIVIFAKNGYIKECLIKQMKNHIFKKEYIALLTGILPEESGTISASISRKEGSIIERKVSANGAIAITHYNNLKNYDNYCLVHFILETGRTHQIRVHSQHIGHPILGDSLYGTNSPLIKRQALHAYKVTFIHPITHQTITFEAPVPQDINKLI